MIVQMLLSYKSYDRDMQGTYFSPILTDVNKNSENRMSYEHV